ncbi:MAG: phage portal protein [Methanotrichaceae archaeon]
MNPGEPWPPTGETARLARYTRNTLLFEGDHSLAFPGLNPRDDPRRESIVANWFRRSVTLISDLATGEAPKFSSDNQEGLLDRILEDNAFQLTLYDLVGDIQRYGNALLKVRFDGRRGVIERVNPAYWYPVVSPDNAQDIQAHVLAYNFTEYIDHVKKTFLRVEVHHRGRIENKLYDLDSGGRITRALNLGDHPRYADLPPEQETGVDDFLIIPLQNTPRAGGVYGLDDFQNIEGLVRELEKRLIRTSKTLDKFSDPNIAGPEAILGLDPETGEPTITMGGGLFFPIAEGEPYPRILVWDASLQSNFQQIEEIKSQLMATGEISPALLGDTRNGLAESGSALKRLAIPTLAKVNRLRLRIRGPILHALRLCAELEVAARMPGASELENLSLAWRSSLPADPAEAAGIERTRKDGGLTSTRMALARLDPDATDEDLDREAAAIKDEKAADALTFM